MNFFDHKDVENHLLQLCPKVMEHPVCDGKVLLTEAYGEDRMSHPHVFEWHKQFSEGGESVKDCDQPGHSCKSVTTNNTEKVQDVIRKDRRLGF